MMKRILTNAAVCITLFTMLLSCSDFEEGYRVDYSESPAEFNVTALTHTIGAIGDTITFSIEAKSLSNIKTIIVQSSSSGGTGTGYVIKAGTVDPLIDHAYGTIQKDTRELDILYSYVVGQDSSRVDISFALIDGDGKKTKNFRIQTVPSVTTYNNVTLFFNTPARTDGFSTFHGISYKNMANYATVTEANIAVQESIDMAFTVDEGTGWIVSPYDWRFGANFNSRNKTLFMPMASMTESDFDSLTNGSLAYFVDRNLVDAGATSLGNLKVGDIVGFKTDLASANSFKYGILRVKEMRPANSDWYDGLSYKLTMDVVTQIKK